MDDINKIYIKYAFKHIDVFTKILKFFLTDDIDIDHSFLDDIISTRNNIITSHLQSNPNNIKILKLLSKLITSSPKTDICKIRRF